MARKFPFQFLLWNHQAVEGDLHDFPTLPPATIDEFPMFISHVFVEAPCLEFDLVLRFAKETATVSKVDT
jgi:hypothetical protein